MSSPTLTTAVTSAGGITASRPRRRRAAPTPPASAAITRRTLVRRRYWATARATAHGNIAPLTHAAFTPSSLPIAVTTAPLPPLITEPMTYGPTTAPIVLPPRGHSADPTENGWR